MENNESYHIFYFSFTWQDLSMKNVPFVLNSIKPKRGWVRKPETLDLSSTDCDPGIYNERCYFYEYTHQILFDGGGSSRVCHFEREEFDWNDTSNVRYIIKTKAKEYDLKVDKISLDLYELGVGILSFFIANDAKTTSIEDVCAINNYGRCVYLPNWEEFKNCNNVPEKISIEGLRQFYSHDYCSHIDLYGREIGPWTLPTHIYELLQIDLFGNYPSIKISPALDNRMFVSCWYGDNRLSDNLAKLDLVDKKSEYLVAWKSLCEIDLFDKENSKVINIDDICGYTYTLWKEYGTLYGMTRYSFVCVCSTNDFSSSLKKHLQTLYSRMLELVMLQKSSVLSFSEEISKISLEKDDEETFVKEVQYIYQQYITFIIHVCFDDVTPQVQGSDFYNILKEKLEVAKSVDKLNRSIGEVYNSLSATMYASKRERQSRILNWIAILFLPPSLVASYFGMSGLWYDGLTLDLFVAECLWSFGITALLAFVFWIITKVSDKTKKRHPSS